MKQCVTKALRLSLIIILMLAVSLVFADDETVSLESHVVQDFDDPAAQPWFLIGSKFTSQGYPKVAYAKAWPSTLGKADSTKEQHSLGIAMLFDRKEYNWVDVIPGTKTGSGEDVKYTPKEIPLPGRIAALDMWIWSGNYDFYVEVYLRDQRGIVHVLPIGNLTHIGWKNFRVNVPTNIPQSRKYLPRTESLTIVKFRIWTRPTEVAATPTVGDVTPAERAIYFYFDQVKVLTDTFETMFDGDKLLDPKVISEIWGSSDTAKSNSSK